MAQGRLLTFENVVRQADFTRIESHIVDGIIVSTHFLLLGRPSAVGHGSLDAPSGRPRLGAFNVSSDSGAHMACNAELTPSAGVNHQFAIHVIDFSICSSSPNVAIGRLLKLVLNPVSPLFLTSDYCGRRMPIDFIRPGVTTQHSLRCAQRHTEYASASLYVSQSSCLAAYGSLLQLGLEVLLMNSNPQLTYGIDASSLDVRMPVVRVGILE
ncbi:hypothetical protein HCBG_05697 [Histoplasma capsulatum G186AR]|uniref:Uncharacterized protein n=1 Tax=Ajellomyces capsulatus (strain G186AR / H82 / ATCC MYA-2454 / RMSCC 2432) TaxID=447093 RepID=C0NQA9_AJECG|nr:uncharacterized protein HCBG_05697 [Histoplasma capsulatum G186AR]EEH06381.1 hypothetical protein HCBG_05697 [Histoplasma capsulatum G186AR]